MNYDYDQAKLLSAGTKRVESFVFFSCTARSGSGADHKCGLIFGDEEIGLFRNTNLKQIWK